MENLNNSQSTSNKAIYGKEYNKEYNKEKISHLIIASNPNLESLTVHAAQYTCTMLKEKNLIYKYFHLDQINYQALLTHEEIVRRASFDDQTLEFQKLLSQVEYLGLFFPDWWSLPPALLVGWIQRVFAPNVAFYYEGEQYMPKKSQPLLENLKVILAISSDEPDRALILHSYSFFTQRIFSQAGIINTRFSILEDTHHSSNVQRKSWIQKSAELFFD